MKGLVWVESDQNIECIFYEVIQLIEKVKEQKGKVLIHCVQGVSRSVSLCIAYLIFKEKVARRVFRGIS
jgi:protein-tyrosine phosphatase